MFSFLTRPTGSQRSENAIETARFLFSCAGLFLFFQAGLGAKIAGLAVCALCLRWGGLRQRARRQPGVQWRCGLEQDAKLHYWGSVLCMLLGTFLAGTAPHIAHRIAGLVIIACGAAIVATDHQCRFSKTCHRRQQRPWPSLSNWED